MTKDKNNFETNLKKLEAIVDKLENGEVDLEESVKLYEEGMKLKKNCEESKSVRNLITEKRKYYMGVSKELKELKKLYKSGDLTEEEYVKAK